MFFQCLTVRNAFSINTMDAVSIRINKLVIKCAADLAEPDSCISCYKCRGDEVSVLVTNVYFSTCRFNCFSVHSPASPDCIQEYFSYYTCYICFSVHLFTLPFDNMFPYSSKFWVVDFEIECFFKL